MNYISLETICSLRRIHTWAIHHLVATIWRLWHIVMLYLCKTSLSWKNSAEHDEHDTIFEQKKTSFQILFSELLIEFAEYLNYSRALRSDEKPDYHSLRVKLRRLFNHHSLHRDNLLNWTAHKMIAQEDHDARMYSVNDSSFDALSLLKMRVPYDGIQNDVNELMHSIHVCENNVKRTLVVFMKISSPDNVQKSLMDQMQNILLYQHLDFWHASQHIAAGPDLHIENICRRMPAHLWKYGITNFLKAFRVEEFNSRAHLSASLELCYKILFQLMNAVSVVHEEWDRMLQDLFRFESQRVWENGAIERTRGADRKLNVKEWDDIEILLVSCFSDLFESLISTRIFRSDESKLFLQLLAAHRKYVRRVTFARVNSQSAHCTN